MNIKQVTENSKLFEVDLSDIQDNILKEEVQNVANQYKQYIDKQILIGLTLPTTILLNEKIYFNDRVHTLSDIQCILEQEQKE